MFTPEDILYEDNHLLIVNKRCGDLVQPDPSGESALEDQRKAFVKRRDAKPGDVFLGVVHRIDRPVSGAVLFAKTSKALTRLNEMIREGRIRKVYWALTERTPDPESGELRHYILRDARTNRSRACDGPKPGAKEALVLLRNAGRVSSVCNDVVGDICGIVSGTTTAVIVVRLQTAFALPESVLLSVAVTALVSGLTIGGKALGKTVALNKSTSVVYWVGRFLHLFHR